MVVLNVDLGLRGIGSRNSGWKFARGIPRIPRRGGDGPDGPAIISQISFLKWVHGRTKAEEAAERLRAEKERPRGVDRSVHAGIRRRSSPHSHAWTRAHAHEYRFIAAMGATTPRRNENDPYRATHAATYPPGGESVFGFEVFFFFSIEFGRK